MEESLQLLVKHGLKVTPQRLAVLDALFILRNHPTAETIIEFIRTNHPNIATGTVYKTLETFVNQKVIRRVKTDSDAMRYDAITETHHHLHSVDSERIEDYFDAGLNEMLRAYFEQNDIPGFEIQEVNVQIIGHFVNKQHT